MRKKFQTGPYFSHNSSDGLERASILKERYIRDAVLCSVPKETNPDVQLTCAAVLIAIVFAEDGKSKLIFTKRSENLSHHKGEISFPGGVVEKKDGSFVDAALREASEEIGLDTGKIEVIGNLDGVETTSGFWIIPVVGIVKGAIEYQVNEQEVSEVFEVPVEYLLRPGVRSVSVVEQMGIRFTDYRFRIEDCIVWGATGRMLNSFMEKIVLSGYDR